MSARTRTAQSRNHITSQGDAGGQCVDTALHLTSVEFAEHYVAKRRPVLLKHRLAARSPSRAGHSIVSGDNPAAIRLC